MSTSIRRVALQARYEQRGYRPVDTKALVEQNLFDTVLFEKSTT